MGSHNQCMTGDLKLPNKPKSRGKIIVQLEKVSTCNDMVYFDAIAVNLPSKKFLWFGNNNPFFFIERSRTPDSDEFIRVIQSQPKHGTTSPRWNKLKYSAKQLWNGDPNNRLKFWLYSYDSAGHHKPYGEFYTSLTQLINGETHYELYKIDSAEMLNRQFVFDNLFIEERPSFFDFLRSGWEINLTVAVDFTSSNGTPTYPDSLHYMDPRGFMNQYQNALNSVGAVLQNYDTDNKIPAFGFGGVPLYMGAQEVSHCFHLNGVENPEWDGLKGLLDAYNFSLANVKLYGPTFFAPLLETFIAYVQSNLGNPLYHVLLILTDGDIHDMSKTKDLIVAASGMPISIIIVGIGEDDFELMIELDGDEVILKNHKGQPAQRDIVQFVKFNEYKQAGMQALAEEVLREVPEQVVSFLTANKISLKGS